MLVAGGGCAAEWERDAPGEAAQSGGRLPAAEQHADDRAVQSSFSPISRLIKRSHFIFILNTFMLNSFHCKAACPCLSAAVHTDRAAGAGKPGPEGRRSCRHVQPPTQPQHWPCWWRAAAPAGGELHPAEKDERCAPRSVLSVWKLKSSCLRMLKDDRLNQVKVAGFNISQMFKIWRWVGSVSKLFDLEQFWCFRCSRVKPDSCPVRGIFIH